MPVEPSRRDELLELANALQIGEWQRSVLQGPNPTWFTIDATEIARSAAAVIRALICPNTPDERCPLCDNSGDIHTIDGEWRGECPDCTPDEPKEPPVPMSDDVLLAMERHIEALFALSGKLAQADFLATEANANAYEAVVSTTRLLDTALRPDTPPVEGIWLDETDNLIEPTPDPFVEAAEEAFVSDREREPDLELRRDKEFMQTLIDLARRGAELGAAREREEIVRHLRWVAEGLDEETRVAAAHVRRCIASAIESRAHMGGK